MATFHILHDKLVFFTETKFVYVPAEVKSTQKWKTNDGDKKTSYARTKPGGLWTCGLTIHIVKFHYCDIQGQINPEANIHTCTCQQDE
jgi:hypothetical protein